MGQAHTENENNKTTAFQWGFSLGIGILLYFLTANIGMEHEICLFTGITVTFILMAAFNLMPVLLLSMLLPCAYMFSGIAEPSVALAPWTNTLMYLVVCGIILSNVLSDCGLLKRLALWFTLRCGGTYYRLVFGLYLICLIVACISFCQAWLLMFTLSIALCKSLGYKAGDKEATVLMMAAFCGTLTATVYTYNPSYAPILDGAYKVIDPALSYPWYHVYLYMLPYIPVCLLFLLILLKGYKIKNSLSKDGLGGIRKEYEAMGAFTLQEKKAAAALIFLFLFLVTSTWHNLEIFYGFIIAVSYLFLPGIRVGKKEAVTSVNMGTISFMVACMSIGVVGASIGFDTIISDMISRRLAGSNAYTVFYTLFGLGAAANFVMTPLAILTCLLQPVVKIALNLGISPMGALYALYASIDFYILPYENAWALVFFGLGMVSFKDFVKLNLLRSVMLTIALGTLFLPWWGLLGIV